MKTAKDNTIDVNDIQSLKARIKHLESENKDQLISQYKYLIGQCLHRAHTSYEKVTNICRVEVDAHETEITFDCICVYVSECDASLSIDSYGHILPEDIDGCLISEEEFMSAFEKSVSIIRNQIKNCIPIK